VADSKLIIGAAVTMTTLEIYLEKLCKTSSGTCITLENLGNNIMMIYIFKVKEYLGEMSGTILLLPTTLNEGRYSTLNVERLYECNVNALQLLFKFAVFVEQN
jgi:hypothetical protein